MVVAALLPLLLTVAAIRPVVTRITRPDYSSPNGLENSPLTTVQAVVGASVLLPCDVTPPTPADAPLLVLFFFSSKGTPIYSVDARGSSLYSGEHWADSEQLENRATLKVRPGQQGLLLSRLTEQDAGQYRCRVDFKASPTRNLRVNLQIIVPPQHILVTSSWDEGRIVSGLVGPYPEGADVTLTCQVTGGTPLPSVTWWQAGSLMDDVSEYSSSQATRNSLRLPRLTRNDLLRKLTCTATNSNMTVPLSAAITIDIAFPPNSVRISAKSSNRAGYRNSDSSLGNDADTSNSISTASVITVRANREEYLTCESSGSRPKAELVWKRNGLFVDEGIYTSPTSVDHDSSMGFEYNPAVSTLLILPTIDDDKTVVSCKAYSPKLPDEPLVHEVSLNVLFQPVIGLSFESDIALDDIEEGDSFSFKCHVKANPAVGQLQWAINGVPILANSTEGISVSGSKLHILKSSRHLSGRYTCAAANPEGVTTSDHIAVKIKFTPVCRSGIQQQYGAGRKEEICITCLVDSHPPPASFKWAFNRSAEIVDIAQSSYSSEGLSSTLNYLPRTELDFGSVLCWAANDVGLMKQPCVMHVVPAAKPEPVRNCQVVHNSSMPRSVALVSCLPGWNGGLEQTFTLEVRETKHKHSRILASVQHSPAPLFNMKGLKHAEEYLFIVTAVNSRGVSPSVTLSYTTPESNSVSSASNLHDSDSTNWLSWTLFAAVVLGVLITFIACLCAVIGLMKFKSSTSEKASAKIVYAGPIRECDEHDKSSALHGSNVIYCDKHDCEVDTLMKGSHVHGSHSGCVDTYNSQEIGELNNKEDQFRSSGSDIRIATPYVWNPDSGSTCEDSYFRNSGPYHINSLSPPPPPLASFPPPTLSRLPSAAPLASCDSLGRSSSSASRPSSSSNYSTSGVSACTVALQPDHHRVNDHVTDSCRTPLMRDVSRESAV